MYIIIDEVLRENFDQLTCKLFSKIEKEFENINISQLKKQIKYSKNLLEIKSLNKKLNELYKD